jgi:lysozyme family protein
MAYLYESLRNEYARKWDKMVIDENKLDAFNSAADRIISHKNDYIDIEKETNVPWYFIGLLHLRESNLNFKTHLHNGDPLSARTRHVPAGRPREGSPPFSFKSSAIDALKMKGYDTINDWTIERIAFCLEKYNGFGYRAKNVESPYLWSWTDQYSIGKFVADHVFDPTVYDKQLGCMGVLKCIFDKQNINIARDTPKPEYKAEIPNPKNKELKKVSRKYWWADFVQKMMTMLGIGGTGVSLLDASNISSTKSYIDVLKSFGSEYGILMLIGATIAGALLTTLLKQYVKEDIKQGRYIPSGESE